MSNGDWIGLLSLAAAVVGFAWKFSLRVVRELTSTQSHVRATRTDVRRVKKLCNEHIIPRLKKLEQNQPTSDQTV